MVYFTQDNLVAKNTPPPKPLGPDINMQYFPNILYFAGYTKCKGLI